MEDKYPELLEEMPKVRADLGYPPLVTPTSQMVGSMSAFNVMLGRYKVYQTKSKDWYEANMAVHRAQLVMKSEN